MSPSKPVLIVIAGPNGSGKTEITRILRTRYDWTEGLIEINPDNIAQEQSGDWNDPAAVLMAARQADALREGCLTRKEGLLFETVLSTPQKIDFISRAKSAGYFIRVIFVGTENPEINRVRVEWRVENGGHSVPLEKIISCYQRSMKLGIEAAKIADRAYFVDNSRDVNPDDVIGPFTVFRTINGTIAKTYVDQPSFPDCYLCSAAMITWTH